MRAEEKRVTDALGYTFHDEALLRRALTHPSAGKADNQRLEFLGDAVLQYLMSDRLYRKHPEDREGSLTHMRALLVCEAALSPIAQRLGIGEALIMDMEDRFGITVEDDQIMKLKTVGDVAAYIAKAKG